MVFPVLVIVMFMKHLVDPDAIQDAAVIEIARDGELLGWLVDDADGAKIRFSSRAIFRGLTLCEVWDALDQACRHVAVGTTEPLVDRVTAAAEESLA